MSRSVKSVQPRLVFGLTLVVIGFLFLLDHLFVYQFHIEDYWPLLLIIWGIVRFSSHGSRGWGFSASLMIFGAIFLLNDYFPFSYIFDWENLWPLALIVLGGYLITRNLNQNRANENVSDPASAGGSDGLKAFTILGGRKSFITSSSFSGGEVTVTLGGLEIDCSQAKLSTQTPEVTIDVTVVMGGVELIVPEDWLVEVRATPVLGGIEDNRKKGRGVNTQGTTLIIDGVVLLGGVEILTAPN
jgi:predicted membrane protein